MSQKSCWFDLNAAPEYGIFSVMLNHWPLRACLILSCVGSSAVFGSPLPKGALPDGPLTVEQIVERAVTRAQWTSRLNRHTNYAYEKTTTTEEIDGKGRAKSRKEKTVQFECGVGTLKELTLNGKPVSEREFKKEAEAMADRQQLGKTKSDRRDDNWSQYLSKDIVARYTFELVGCEQVAGRDVYVLSFKPVSDKLPVKQITDRLLNRLSGKVWLDAREFEVAKAQIRLRDEVTMWGGLLGSMKQFDYDIERARIDENYWGTRVSNFELEGRKLFDTTHLRVRSETGNFRKPLAFK